MSRIVIVKSPLHSDTNNICSCIIGYKFLYSYQYKYKGTFVAESEL
jgi:hypothetical protein